MKNYLIIIGLALLTSCGEDSPFGDRDELMVSFDIENNECQAPCQVTFTNTSEFAERFIWDFDDGSPLSMEENPTHLFESAGVFDVTLTITRGEESKSRSQLVRILPRSDQPMIIETQSLAYNTIGLDVVEIEGDIMVLAQSNNTGSALLGNDNRNHLLRYTKSAELIEVIDIPKEWEINDMDALGSTIYIIGEDNDKAFIAQLDLSGNVLDIEPYLDSERSKYTKLCFAEGSRPMVIGTAYNDNTSLILFQEFDSALNRIAAFEFLDLEDDLTAVDISYSDDKVYLAYNENNDIEERGVIESYDKSSFGKLATYRVHTAATAIYTDASGVYLTSLDETHVRSDIWKFNHDLIQLQHGSLPNLEVTRPYPTDLIRHKNTTVANTSNLDFEGGCLSKSIFHTYDSNYGIPNSTTYLDCVEYDNNGFYTVNMISDGENIYAVGFLFTNDEIEEMFLLKEEGEF